MRTRPALGLISRPDSWLVSKVERKTGPSMPLPGLSVFVLAALLGCTEKTDARSDLGPATGPMDVGEPDLGLPDLGQDTGHSDLGVPDFGPVDSGDAGAPFDLGPLPPNCRVGCTLGEECVTSGSILFDQNNYNCELAICIYKGCVSDVECAAAFASEDYSCVRLANERFPTCHLRCDTPGECAGRAPLFDEENYRCEFGLCAHAGCLRDEECIEFNNDAQSRCRGGFCIRACSVPADCDQGTPLFDENNYLCTDGLCEWIGCVDNSECNPPGVHLRVCR